MGKVNSQLFQNASCVACVTMASQSHTDVESHMCTHCARLHPEISLRCNTHAKILHECVCVCVVDCVDLAVEADNDFVFPSKDCWVGCARKEILASFDQSHYFRTFRTSLFDSDRTVRPIERCQSRSLAHRTILSYQEWNPDVRFGSWKYFSRHPWLLPLRSLANQTLR